MYCSGTESKIWMIEYEEGENICTNMILESVMQFSYHRLEKNHNCMNAAAAAAR